MFLNLHLVCFFFLLKRGIQYRDLYMYSTAGGKVSPCLTVSHGIPQITTGDIVSRQFCGNHPCLKISVIIPGRQPCPMVITEIFRNGPYYHGTQYVPWEFVGHRGIPWDTGNFTTGSTVHVHHVLYVHVHIFNIMYGITCTSIHVAKHLGL